MNPTDSSPPSYHSVDGKRQDIKNGEKAGNISTKSTSGWRTTLNREIFHRCDSVARSLAEQKRKAAMKQLLKSGFDITIKSFDKVKAICWAANWENISVIRLLLEEEEADVNANGPGKVTLLHFAACKGRLAVVRLLLEKGADISVRDASGGDGTA
jgi:ankyrin repeat protein